jgi:hypothetical protein
MPRFSFSRRIGRGKMRGAGGPAKEASVIDRRVRLGDVVDDYCPRCRLIMNHGIMALADDVIMKVQCHTCMNEHPYRHGRKPRKKDPIQAAYEELLGKGPKAPAPKKGGPSDGDPE